MIEILKYTENPLKEIGINASYCYDTDLKDEEHPIRIAKHCINSGHGRNLEFVDVTLKVTCSARVAREFYTHIGGAPTRVQASTRYIAYNNFNYVVPGSLTTYQRSLYELLMENIKATYEALKDSGLENDKAGYILPLSMETTFIWKGNIRTLENMFNQRLCYRALEEYRLLMQELKKKLSSLNSEWKWISDKLFVAKCIKSGYCIEGKKDCVLYKEKLGGIEMETAYEMIFNENNEIDFKKDKEEQENE